MSMPSDGRRYQGAFGNGRTAVTTPVDVRLTSHGLEIRAEGERQARLWPYAELQSSVPLLVDDKDVLLSRAPGGLETLFVADATFPRALLARTPALSPARRRWQGVRPGLALVAAVAVIAGGIWALDVSPPQTVARMMPQQVRETLGRNVVTSLAGQYRACDGAAGRAALDRLTQRLSTAAAANAVPVQVMLLDWGLINAFAAPGGQIILTRGLVQQAGSADEVAAVLAHEMGHAIELHPETGLVRVIGLTAAAQLILAGSSGTLSNIGVILTQLRYTRIAEREADTHALRLLKGAGISPKGFGDFFERLEGRRPAAQQGKGITDYEVIRTHPLTAERLAMIRAQPAYPATPALSPEDWRALREACGAPRPPAPAPAAPSGDATASPTPAPTPGKQSPQAEQDIAEATRTLANNPKDVAALQKRAGAYARRSQHDLALLDYAKAIELKPDDAALHYGRGLALQNLRRHEDAISAYDEVLRLAPAHANARNGRGNVNRTLRRWDAALQDFEELIRTRPDYIHARYNRAMVLREADRLQEALGAFSETMARDKDYTAALTGRGLTHEKMGAREAAIADFRAALAMPAKYNNGAWAHRVARERLKALGAK